MQSEEYQGAKSQDQGIFTLRLQRKIKNRKIGIQHINKNTTQVKCQRSQGKKVLQVKTAATTNKMRTEKQHWIK